MTDVVLGGGGGGERTRADSLEMIDLGKFQYQRVVALVLGPSMCLLFKRKHTSKRDSPPMNMPICPPQNSDSYKPIV